MKRPVCILVSMLLLCSVASVSQSKSYTFFDNIETMVDVYIEDGYELDDLAGAGVDIEALTERYMYKTNGAVISATLVTSKPKNYYQQYISEALEMLEHERSETQYVFDSCMKRTNGNIEECQIDGYWQPASEEGPTFSFEAIDNAKERVLSRPHNVISLKEIQVNNSIKISTVDINFNLFNYGYPNSQHTYLFYNEKLVESLNKYSGKIVLFKDNNDENYIHWIAGQHVYIYKVTPAGFVSIASMYMCSGLC